MAILVVAEILAGQDEAVPRRTLRVRHRSEGGIWLAQLAAGTACR